MNRTLSKGALTQWASSLAWMLLAMGVLGSQSVFAAGIADTKHNLGPTTTAGNNTFDPTDATNEGELCVFCHTPHGADTTAAVPLWNRKLGSQGAAYLTYNTLGTSSLDGATAPVGSVSIACLSCHDGTQAMNVMINQPGSGGYTSTGAAWAGTWTGTDVVTAAGATNGQLINAGTSYSLLGTDLKNDHPVGIQYGGGMPSGGAYTTGNIAAGALKDADFNGIAYAALNGQPAWWVDTAGGTTGTRQKTDIQLYTRTNSASINYDNTAGATLAGAQAFVECASCHDPHSSINQTFLRIANTGSAVCLACHIK